MVVKTKEQLVEELAEMRQRITELEAYITEHKQIEVELKKERGQLHTTLEAVSDGVAFTDMELCITDINEAGVCLLGYDHKEEVIGRSGLDFLSSKDHARAAVDMRGTLEKGYSGRVEYTFLDKKGREFLAEYTVSVVKDESGGPVGFTAAMRDITERKRAEEALQRSEQNFRNSLDSSPLGICIVTPEGELLYANKAILDIYGYSSIEELKATPTKQLYTPESYAEHRERKERRKLGKPVSSNYEISVVCKEGGVRHLAVHRRPVLWNGGKQFQMLYEDITERKRAEEAIRAQRDKLEGIIASMVDGVDIISRDYRVDFQNKVLRDRFGDLRGQLCYAGYMGRESPCEDCPMVKAIATGRTQNVETVGADGREYEVTSTPFEDIDGETKVIEVVRDITGRKQVDQTLKESEEKYRRLVEDSAEGIVIVQGIDIRFVNRAMLEMFGCRDSEEMVGYTFTDFVSPEHRKLMEQRGFDRESGKDVPSRYGFRALRKDGTEFDVEICVSKIFYQGCLARQGVIRDITERKRAEETLRESEALHSSLVNQALDGIVIIQDEVFKFTNRAFSEMIGYREDELLGKPFQDVIMPGDRDLVKERHRRRMAGEDVPPVYETWLVRKDGTGISVEVSAGLTHYQGRLANLTYLHDLTERKRAEEALKESEERYRDLFENSSEAIFTTDLEGRITSGNRAFEELTGYSLKELGAMDWKELAPPESAESFFKGYRELFQTREPRRNVVHEVIRRDGERRVTEGFINLIRKGDKIVGFQESVRDITERKRAEEALEQSEQNFRNSLDNSPLGIRIVTADGGLLYANKAILDIYGYNSVEELKATPAKQRYTPESYAAHRERKRKRKLGQPVPSEYEVSIVRKDGKVRHLLVSRREVIWNGETQFQALYRDVTEHKRAEEALQAERNRLFNVLEVMPMMVCLLSPDYHVVFSNRAFRDKFGESHGRHCYEYCFGKKEPCDFCQTYEVLKTGKPHRWEITSQDGSTDIEAYDFPFTDVDGSDLILEVDVDITERKRAVEKLRESEERFRIASQIATDVVYERDLQTGIATFYGGIDERLGYEPGEYPRTMEGWREHVHPEDLSQIDSQSIDQLESGIPYDVEYRMRKKDGTYMTWSDRIMVIRDEKTGKPVKFIGAATDITERKRVEEALRESEERYRGLFENSIEAVFTSDLEGSITSGNKAFGGVLGYDLKELVGMNWRKTVTPESAEYISKEYKNLFRTGKPIHDVLYESVRKDGERRLTEGYANVIRKGGRITGFQGTLRDITEHKRAEEALKESEERYRGLFENSIEAVFTSDLEGKVTSGNRALEELTGYDLEELVGMNWEKTMPPEGVESVLKEFSGMFRTGEPIRGLVYETIRKDGERRLIEANVQVIRRGGRIVGCQGTVRDVTEQKQAEEALKESEEKFRLIAERIAEDIWLADLNGQVTYISPAVENIFGYTPEEAMNLSFSAFLLESEIGRGVRAFNRAVSGQEYQVLEFTGRRKDGTSVPIEVSVTPIVKDNTIIGVQGVARDITERKRAEEALRESEERYRGLFENSLEAIFTADSDGNITSANKALEELIGYTLEELSKMRPAEKIAPESSDLVLEQYQRVLSTGEPVRSLVYETFRKDGQRRIVEGYITALKKEDRIVGFQGVVRDITERKRAEEELESSRQQLRNLARYVEAAREWERTRIARELHDEMGQSLTALKMDLSWLSNALSPDQIPLRDKTESMSELTDAAIEMVKRISTELRPGILDDLGLAAAIEWQAEEFQKRTGIECQLTISPEDIALDQLLSTALFRIVQEALTNVTRHAQATRVKISLQEEAGRLQLKVRDNGKGITKEALSDPKSLGLVGMRERLLTWNGEVKIRGVEGKGTTITASIPLGQEEEMP